MSLKEAISKRLSLKVYIKDDGEETYIGVWKFIKEKNIYQGQFGKLDLDKIMLCAMGDKSMSHIKLEIGE